MPGHFGTYLHSQIGTCHGQFGTCHGQFGTSVKNNFVIIKYLYIKKEKELDLLASTKYNLVNQRIFFL